MLSKEQKAAFKTLMDDPSPKVRTALFLEFERLGKTVQDWLDELAEGEEQPLATIAKQWHTQLVGEDPKRAFIEFIESFQYELETGCLLLDRTAFPELDPTEYYASIDAIATRCRSLIAFDADGFDVCTVICRIMFEEYGFRGDTEDYYNPLNSYLHQAVRRRRGLPITLAVLFIIVADRCGFEMRPVGLPGHFLVGCFLDDEPFYIDVFAGGAILRKKDLKKWLRKRGIALDEAYFKPTPTGEVLCRFCRNLANQYAAEQDEERAKYYSQFVQVFEEAYRKHARS